MPPEILDQHYKIGPSADHRAKFHAGRPTHLGDLVSGEKTSGLKLKSAPQAIASGGLITAHIMNQHYLNTVNNFIAHIPASAILHVQHYMFSLCVCYCLPECTFSLCNAFYVPTN